jgi:hypothetical protein
MKKIILILMLFKSCGMAYGEVPRETKKYPHSILIKKPLLKEATR